MLMPCEKHFKHTRKFWFQDANGYRHTAKECCSGEDGLPCEVIVSRATTQINQGLPITNATYKCGICGKALDVEA